MGKEYFLKFKSLFLFMFFFISITVNFLSPVLYTYATKIYYARITLPATALYAFPLVTSEIKFYLAQSYFVKLLKKENENFYEVEYMNGITGYVQKSDLKFVIGTPINPFPSNLNLQIIAPDGLNLCLRPCENETTVIKIPRNKTVSYYGEIHGEKLIPYQGYTDIWYYCKYTDGENEYFGYLYYYYCYPSIISTVQNNEVLDLCEEPDLNQTSEATTQPDFIASLSKTAQYVIIFLVCLPCILIIYLLFKPTKITVDNGKRKRKIRKLKKSDYYEIDDNK